MTSKKPRKTPKPLPESSAPVLDLIPPLGQPQQFLQHLVELQFRIRKAAFCWFGCVIGCYLGSEYLFAAIVYPLTAAIPSALQRRLIFTGLPETFFSYIKLSLWTGTILALPYILNQLWLFIGPGLYNRERRLIRPFLWISPLLFISGALFAYFIVLPNAWRFFLSFERPGMAGSLPIVLEPRVQEYLSLSIQILLAFGLSFQMPVGLFFLVQLKILSLQALRQGRRYAFIGILIVSAFLTPPDVLSMIALAIPLYGLYELTILGIGFLARRREKD